MQECNKAKIIYINSKTGFCLKRVNVVGLLKYESQEKEISEIIFRAMPGFDIE